MQYVVLTVVLVLLLSCVNISVVCAQANEPGPLRVGIASADITPRGPVPMRGFAARDRLSEGVSKELIAQCVVFDNGQTRLAIVALDLCAYSDRHLLRLQAAATAAGIPQQHLMVNWQHSHFTPSLGLGDIEYYTLFSERTEALFAAAVDNLQPALLEYTVGTCVMAMGYRQFDGPLADGVRAPGRRPEPRLPIDPEVPIMRVLNAEGQVRAVIFGYACHPTTVAGDVMYLICTDFPGYARDWIAAAYPGAEVIFLQGCGGDMKPGAATPSDAGIRGSFGTVLLDSRETKAAMGYELGRAVCRALAVPPPPVPRDRATELEEALNTPIALGGMVELVDLPLGQDPEQINPLAWYMGAWRIGDVYIFASKGEVYAHIGQRIKDELADLRVWTNGYTFHGGGYICGHSIVVDGVEIPGSHTAFAPEAEDTLVDNAKRYIRALQISPLHTDVLPRSHP